MSDPESVPFAKADEDRKLVLRVIDDESISNEIVGFHCQQAVEKYLKSVLVRRGIDYGRTHDLTYLVNVIKEAGIPLPPDAMELDSLTPYAVPYRYDFVPDEEVLDRVFVLKLVENTRTYATSLLAP